jgi:hypothetical protein
MFLAKGHPLGVSFTVCLLALCLLTPAWAGVAKPTATPNTSAGWVALQPAPSSLSPVSPLTEFLAAPTPLSQATSPTNPDTLANDALLLARHKDDAGDNPTLKDKLFGWFHRNTDEATSTTTDAQGWQVLDPSPTATTPTTLPPAQGLNPQQLVSFIQLENPRHTPWQTQGIANSIFEASQRNALDPKLLASVVAVESSFRPHAISSSGAMGMGQLLPSTARWLQVSDPFDPVDNLLGTSKYLRYLQDLFAGDENKAVASYFVGQGTVQRQGISPAAKQYVDKVNAKRSKLEQL